jgi:hypothetical protein
MNFELQRNHFENIQTIEERVEVNGATASGKLRTVLKYLYLTDGPYNLSRKDQLKPVEKYLSIAEIKVARWLSTLTNGTRSRKVYGKNALMAFRRAKGCCAICKEADVRCLEMDHINSIRSAESPQQCICANCHKKCTYDRLMVRLLSK